LQLSDDQINQEVMYEKSAICTLRCLYQAGGDFKRGEQRGCSMPLIAIDRASRVCRALGEPARLRLMAPLAAGELCVTELAEAEGEELSTISQRLRVLRAENIVVRRRRGRHINYALADDHMSDLVATVLAHASEPVEPVLKDDQPTEEGTAA
jgi:DNA-binding transcriptional ArsR family regulator